MPLPPLDLPDVSTFDELRAVITTITERARTYQSPDDDRVGVISVSFEGHSLVSGRCLPDEVEQVNAWLQRHQDVVRRYLLELLCSSSTS